MVEVFDVRDGKNHGLLCWFCRSNYDIVDASVSMVRKLIVYS